MGKKYRLTAQRQGENKEQTKTKLGTKWGQGGVFGVQDGGVFEV